MKIIGIVGSPRKIKGNTGRLLLEVLKGAEAEGATYETVALPGGTVKPCKACDVCHKKGTARKRMILKTSRRESSPATVSSSPVPTTFSASAPS